MSGRIGGVTGITEIVIILAADLLYEFGDLPSYAWSLHDAALATIAAEPIRHRSAFSTVLEVPLAIYSVVVFAALAGSVGAFFLERARGGRRRAHIRKVMCSSPCRGYVPTMRSKRTSKIVYLSVLLAIFSACARGGDIPLRPDQSGSGTGKPRANDPNNPDGGESGEQAKKRTIDDLGPLGSAARAILDPHSYAEVVVELAFVQGREPGGEARSHVEQVIGSVAKKPIRITTHEIRAGDGSYTSQEIIELSKNRSTSSSGNTASIWVGFLDGRFAENDNALGVAVAATVAAVFPDRIGAVGSLLSPSGIEKSVLLHEIGHILALINIASKSKIDREDPEHPHHSKNEGSVMHWAVEDISVRNVFRGGPPSDFDDADRADLEMLRSS